MAGLLDLPDFNSAAGQGLLAASLSLMGAQKMPGQKGAFGSALANAGRTYMDTRNQAGEQLQAQEYKRLQLDALKRKIEQEKQQATEAERVRNLIAGAGQPMPGMGGTNLVNDALPPDLQIGALKPLQEPGKIDYQALVRSGVPYELVKQLADSQNLGRQKVARTADIEGPNGSKLVQGYDDYGQPVGQGVNGYVAPVSVNQGNQTSFVKPMAGLSLPMGMSPAEQSAANDRNRTFGLQRERLNFDQANNQNGKAPAGYRWKQDGSMEAIPGGPADTRVGSVGARANDARDALSIIAEAKALIPKSTGSGFGAALDSTAGFFGSSTEGAQAGAQLKALEGMLVSKMPKMTGPQSDKDVLLYKQMAGQVGDTSLPKQTRMSALDVIQRMQEQYAGQTGGAGESWDNKPKTVTLSDIQATARASGKTTEEVTQALRAKGYKIGGQ